MREMIRDIMKDIIKETIKCVKRDVEKIDKII